MLAAVATTFNEADIIARTLTHLYNEGVANIYIADASTDGTRDALSEFPCRVFDDTEPCHRQPYWTSLLAQRAFEDGADWVIPFDADEFWCGLENTLAETLEQLPDSAGKIMVSMYQYLDFDYREPDTKPLRKVLFRAADGVTVANGNHDAAGTIGETVDAPIVIREVQYRGFEHFVRKIDERCATLDPALPNYEGTHHTQYRGWSKEQLEPEWEKLVAKATVLDPIPVRR